MNAQKVFISHSSLDKERFVIGFAEKLRENGIDAWLDEWEMQPGDSLVSKIFDAIEQSPIIIVVVSSNSFSSKWVKEELSSAVMQRVAGKARIIPVVIDDCEVHFALKSILQVRVENLSDYKDELNNVIKAVFNVDRRPPLGTPPAYVTHKSVILPGLSSIDNQIFELACEFVLSSPQRATYIGLGVFQIEEKAKALGIDKQTLIESLEILGGQNYVELAYETTGSRGPSRFSITLIGFERYCAQLISDYQSIKTAVALQILNEGKKLNKDVAANLGQPILIINHIFKYFESKQYIKISTALGGNYEVWNISPLLKRNIERL